MRTTRSLWRSPRGGRGTCRHGGCGKKGPPLAPFVRVPAAVTAVTPQRVGDDVYLSFTVPATNVDGQKPADIGAVEVYAVTSATRRRPKSSASWRR